MRTRIATLIDASTCLTDSARLANDHDIMLMSPNQNETVHAHGCHHMGTVEPRFNEPLYNEVLRIN